MIEESKTKASVPVCHWLTQLHSTTSLSLPEGNQVVTVTF